MKHPDILPPKYSSQFLNWALPAELRDPIMGDLDEEYIQQLLNNPANADNWYRNQAMRSAIQFIWKTKRGLFMFLISVLVFIGVAIMGMEFGIDVTAYIDVPSLMLVVMPAIFFSIAATSLKSFKLAFTLLINDELTLNKIDMVQAKQTFTVMGNSAVLAGVFSTLMGAIAIAGNLPVVDFYENLGPALAVCFLTLYYGYGLKVLTYVSEQKIQNLINKAELQ